MTSLEKFVVRAVTKAMTEAAAEFRHLERKNPAMFEARVRSAAAQAQERAEIEWARTGVQPLRVPASVRSRVTPDGLVYRDGGVSGVLETQGHRWAFNANPGEDEVRVTCLTASSSRAGTPSKHEAAQAERDAKAIVRASRR